MSVSSVNLQYPVYIVCEDAHTVCNWNYSFLSINNREKTKTTRRIVVWRLFVSFTPFLDSLACFAALFYFLSLRFLFLYVCGGVDLLLLVRSSLIHNKNFTFANRFSFLFFFFNSKVKLLCIHTDTRRWLLMASKMANKCVPDGTQLNLAKRVKRLFH